MPLLKPDLLTIYNDPSKFVFYYGGGGNFTQNKLKYDKDQPGGLWSGEPYVQWPLPNFATPSILAYYAGNRTSLDFPLRGAGLNYDITTGIIKPAAGEYDTVRISRFMKSTPKGLTFITKQTGLQLSNPKIEVGTQANLNPGQTPARFFGEIENTRIYNGGRNTLVQVGYQGSGVHVDRHGITPFNPYRQTYEKVVESYNTADGGSGNRLVTLLNAKIYNQRSTDSSFRNNTNRLGISLSQPLLFQYTGGPGSTYGIGLTTIRRYAYTNNFKSNIVFPFYVRTANPPKLAIPAVARSLGLDLKFIPLATPNERNPVLSAGIDVKTVERGYSLTAILNENENRLARLYKTVLASEKTGAGPIFDADIDVKWDTSVRDKIRTSLFKYQESQEVIYGGPSTEHTAIPEGQANEGQSISFKYADFYKQKKNLYGKILPDFRSTINTSGASSGSLKTTTFTDTDLVRRGDVGLGTADPVNQASVGTDYGDGIQDLVKFKFTPVEYTSQGGTISTKSTPLLFRAYLTDLQDNHSGEYTNFKYTGRGENFYIYNGFTRNVSFGFKIAVLSAGELEPLYDKLNYLASQCYPDYNDRGFMRTPLMKLTIGDYFIEQPGFLQSINISLTQDSPWEIDEGKQLPHVLQATCQYIPIHNFLPQRSKGKTNITPLIWKR